MIHLRTAIAIASLTCVLAPPAGAQKAPTPALADLLRLGAEYAAAYAPKVSGVTLEEQWILVEVSGAQMRTQLRVASDLVLVNNDGRILGLRDPFAIDNRPLRERQPRIAQALAKPTLAAWAAVQEYVRENAHYLQANVVIWFSDPALALQFMAASNQPRLTCKLEGNKKLNGIQTIGVGFKETAAPGTTSVLATPGNHLSSGRFWIDPATGAIHQTELWIQSDADTARIQVVYAPDATLGMLLPRDATHTFETRERGSGGTIGPGGSRVGFESSAKYSNPRYTPIDLTRVVR